MNNQNKKQVAIIGGGLSGLTAGFLLSQKGYAVTLYEAAPQVGGRARSVAKHAHFNALRQVDNGPHLMLGAYSGFISLLQQAGVNLEDAFYQQPFEWFVPKTLRLNMGRDWLATLVNGLAGLIRGARKPLTLEDLGGLSLTEQVAFMRLLWQAKCKTPRHNHLNNKTVSQWFDSLTIPPRLRVNLLEPLCLSAMNTSPHQASAATLARILREVFLSGSSMSWQALWPRGDLTALYAKPLVTPIERHGRIILNARVTALIKQDDQWRLYGKAQGTGEQTLGLFSQVIVALPVWEAAPMLSGVRYLDSGSSSSTMKASSSWQSIAKALQTIESRPIASVYINVPADVGMHGKASLRDCPTLWYQWFEGYCIVWVNDAAIQGLPKDNMVKTSLMSSDATSNDTLLVAIYSCEIPKTISPEAHARCALAEYINGQPSAINTWSALTIHEKRATPAVTVEMATMMEALIPQITALSAQDQLFVCGDYLWADLPATLESTVRSAQKVVEQNF